VALELDGEAWRTVPEGTVVRCSLSAGVVLDRPLARSLARELRRERALGTAVRSLRARPMSEQRLRERLQSRGVRPDAEEAAVGTLTAAGYVDDGRLARGRAGALAERGGGTLRSKRASRVRGSESQTSKQRWPTSTRKPTEPAHSSPACRRRKPGRSFSAGVRLRDGRVRPGRPGRKRAEGLG
jgi:hypothetical protein